MIDEPLALLILALVLLGDWGRDRLSDNRPDAVDPVSDLRQQYVDGDLSIEEFEARLSVALDEDKQAVRERVEAVDGIGPETSAALAQAFPTVEHLRAADAAQLQTVEGVGPERAQALLDER